MRPKERRDGRQKDLFQARLDQIVDMNHPLAKRAAAIDWGFLEKQVGAVYTDRPGHPPLPTRLMAGIAILKHMHNLSDEGPCECWLENPYYQLFCGEEFFQHRLPFDRSSMKRWGQRMGEDKPVALLQESLNDGFREPESIRRPIPIDLAPNPGHPAQAFGPTEPLNGSTPHGD